MALDLFDELKALIRALDANAVDHAVIGALAVAIHGAPRATTDIDLLIDEANLERGLAVARELGFTEAAPMKFRDGTEMRRASKIRGGDTLTLDFMLVTESLQAAWQSRQRLETEFGPLTVVTREALIAMKVAAGRPRDLGDVASLEEQDR
jgi:hypothetical protein